MYLSIFSSSIYLIGRRKVRINLIKEKNNTKLWKGGFSQWWKYLKFLEKITFNNFQLEEIVLRSIGLAFLWIAYNIFLFLLSWCISCFSTRILLSWCKSCFNRLILLSWCRSCFSNLFYFHDADHALVTYFTFMMQIML